MANQKRPEVFLLSTLPRLLSHLAVVLARFLPTDPGGCKPLQQFSQSRVWGHSGPIVLQSCRALECCGRRQLNADIAIYRFTSLQQQEILHFKLWSASSRSRPQPRPVLLLKDSALRSCSYPPTTSTFLCFFRSPQIRTVSDSPNLPVRRRVRHSRYHLEQPGLSSNCASHACHDLRLLISSHAFRTISGETREVRYVSLGKQGEWPQPCLTRLGDASKKARAGQHRRRHGRGGRYEYFAEASQVP